MCILLVEDEQPVREVVTDALAEEGFDICEAETSDQAAGLIEEPPRPFRLLLTDIDLPGRLDGFGLAQLMHRDHPSLPVLYITGRPDRVRALRPQEAMLAKPFSLGDMLCVVRQLLTEQRQADGHSSRLT